MLSFKIGKVFYKHAFSLIDNPEHSKFIGIFGFDFLETLCVIFDLHSNQVKINSNLLDVFYSVHAPKVEETVDLQVNTIFEQTIFTPTTCTQINSPSRENPATVNTTIISFNSSSSSNICPLKKIVVVSPRN